MPQSARDLIRERSFRDRTGTRVGVELEWFTTPSNDPPDVRSLERLLAPVLPLTHGSQLTFEPGGQVEISSAPFTTAGDACDGVAADSDDVRGALARAGVGTFASGVDPDRSRRLLTDAPRYVAMRSYFDEYGTAGGRMMCTTAAIHVNLDAGNDEEGRRRWRIAHAIGPVLVAAFSNSAVCEGELTGWKSSRAAAWRELDPTRTAPADADGDPIASWTRYALGARVMFVRTPERYVPLDEPMTFADWIEDGHPLGYPDADDLEYHLTTLFPPVRAHGYLELRMIDMLPDPWWRAAVVLVTALVCDPDVRSRAHDACAGTEHMWDLAARCGLEDPDLHAAARECFAAALDALDRVGCDVASADAAHEYVTTYTSNGRSPADDQIAEMTTTIAEAI
jgi:glutamate--cysteine ligase